MSADIPPKQDAESASVLRLLHPGAIIFGKKCPACGGYLIVPKAGPEPVTCSPRCRQAEFRRRRREEKNGNL